MRRRFEGTPEDVREARAFLQHVIGGWVDPAMQSDLTLVLSELATNAVRHAQSPFEVVVQTNGHVRIEVADDSTTGAMRRAPSDEGGWGLSIVEQLCDRWGVHIVRHKKCVWCERDLPGR